MRQQASDSVSLEIRKLQPLFAAEIIGADLTGELKPEMIHMVDQAMADYGVVVLRDQRITDEQHIKFSAQFGELERVPEMGFTDKTYRLRRELFDASNLDIDDEICAADHPKRKYSKGNLNWHSDSSYNDLPTRYSFLLAREIPPTGGNTEFADMNSAYHDLPYETKRQIEDLYTIHYLWHSRIKGGVGKNEITDKMKQAMPEVRHKLVRTIHESGKKGLMIGGHCSHIEGWPVEEGREFLEELLDQVTRPQYVYSHRWQDADMVIWDNRCVLHRATEYDDQQYKRDLRRTTVDEFPDRLTRC
jgi:alpha-ketoglutarate-dependent 2,4-dichlorophenoxyacetate dioxygenase